MAYRQHWSLSQDANKSSGICSICHAVRQLHLKDGTVHRHGPRSNPCPGPDKPPLRPSSQQQPNHIQPTTPPTNDPAHLGRSSSQPPPQTIGIHETPLQNAPILNASSNLAATPPIFDHPALHGPTIKHIPASARPACCNLHAKSLDSISGDPLNLVAWRS